MKKLSLYVHIPFCQRKCNYCDFLSGPAGEAKREEYVKALCREIREEGKVYGFSQTDSQAEAGRSRALSENYSVDTLFFGGGTPSLLSPKEMKKIMGALREGFVLEPEAEITIEVNPGTVDLPKLETWRQLGINRLSVGLQSADNGELKELGRIHTWEDFLVTWERIRSCGFSNVNIDLMSALPGQTEESYEDTLKKVIALQPEHISAYSLMVEEGTEFFHRFGPGGKEEERLPAEEEERRMYERTGELLKAAGYGRYEISNYSLPGYECKHNVGYWTGKEYLGLGLGASSLMKHVRFSRERELAVYIRKAKAGKDTVVWREELDRKEQMEEFMFLGLRLTKGVDPCRFQQLFGVTLEEKYGRQIEKLKEKGLLLRTGEGRLALTHKGIDVSNQVFVEFI